MTLLTPGRGGASAYYALFGWAPAGGAAPPTRCRAPTRPGRSRAATTLTETTPVTLRWDNGQGLIFRQTFAVDANYMFTVTQWSRTTPAPRCGCSPTASSRGTASRPT